MTSAIQDLRPGAWLVKCYDDDVGGCQGPPYWVPDGGLICEVHARARGLLVEEAPDAVVEAEPGPLAGDHETPPRAPTEGSTPPP